MIILVWLCASIDSLTIGQVENNVRIAATRRRSQLFRNQSNLPIICRQFNFSRPPTSPQRIVDISLTAIDPNHRYSLSADTGLLSSACTFFRSYRSLQQVPRQPVSEHAKHEQMKHSFSIAGLPISSFTPVTALQFAAGVGSPIAHGDGLVNRVNSAGGASFNAGGILLNTCSSNLRENTTTVLSASKSIKRPTVPLNIVYSRVRTRII